MSGQRHDLHIFSCAGRTYGIQWLHESEEDLDILVIVAKRNPQTTLRE